MAAKAVAIFSGERAAIRNALCIVVLRTKRVLARRLGARCKRAAKRGGGKVDEAALRERIGELLSEAARVPADAGSGAIGFVKNEAAHTSGMRGEMAAVEERLDHLRLAVKYLVFDLEATKRENRVLRELLG